MRNSRYAHTIRSIAPTSLSHRALPYLKALGLILFVWLLLSIDRAALAANLRAIDPALFAASFVLLMLSYVLKVARWHDLVRVAGLSPRFRYSWETYNVGTFLGMITPGKVGEFGRVGYLKTHGVPVGTALAAVLVDRVFDVVTVGVLALGAAGVLFGAAWFFLCAAVCLLGILAAALVAVRLKNTSSVHAWLAFLLALLRRPLLLGRLVLLTVVSWCAYCAWAVVLAWSMGFFPPATALVSAVILAGIVALLPVAPSGLGTRDATLALLLAPYGFAPAQAIALSFSMFLSIVLSSVIGGWYWLKGIGHPHERL